jgi:hypothetical protein
MSPLLCEAKEFLTYRNDFIIMKNRHALLPTLIYIEAQCSIIFPLLIDTHFFDGQGQNDSAGKRERETPITNRSQSHEL